MRKQFAQWIRRAIVRMADRKVSVSDHATEKLLKILEEKMAEMNQARRIVAMDNIEVIGIDHGWSQMKTVNAAVFSSGIREILTEPAFYDDVLEYDGKYYKVGTARETVMENKVENDDYYLLTLASVAKELRIRGKSEANVVLAVGLPASRYGDEKQALGF